jgi:hypothetical protein
MLFFGFGRLAPSAKDRSQERLCFEMLRSALLKLQTPYQVTAIYHDTNRFLAIPKLQLSPGRCC